MNNPFPHSAPPPSPSVRAGQRPPARAPEPNTAGWWCIENLEGARARVIAEIAVLPGVPDWGKAVVLAAIASRPPDLTFFYVDAHWRCGEHAGTDNANLHLTVQGTRAML